jgi:hypothetical protein
VQPIKLLLAILDLVVQVVQVPVVIKMAVLAAQEPLVVLLL